MKYICRLNALTEDQIFTITREGVDYENETIPYSSIESIHLKFIPSRYHANIYQCKVNHVNGSFVISNRRYIKLGTFEYQSSEYNEFVRKLHSHVGDSTRLTCGLNPVRYWIELPLAILFFIVILGVIFTFGHPFLATLFLLLILWRLIPYYRKNYPRSYQKNKIPPLILPRK